MSIQIAKRIGRALDVRSGTRIKELDSGLREYVRTTPQAGGTPMSGIFAANQVTSGTFANARISQSSVTQHQAALSIAWSQITGIALADYVDDTAAALGGVAVGGFYRNGSVVMVRVA